MTIKITHTELSICVDCLSILANGELGAGDDAADQAHGALMHAQWPIGELMSSCEDGCEGWFSWSRCDGCGSTLGGDRHPAVAFDAV